MEIRQGKDFGCKFSKVLDIKISEKLYPALVSKELFEPIREIKDCPAEMIVLHYENNKEDSMFLYLEVTKDKEVKQATYLSKKLIPKHES